MAGAPLIAAVMLGDVVGAPALAPELLVCVTANRGWKAVRSLRYTHYMGTLGQPQWPWDNIKIGRTFRVSVFQFVCLFVHSETISKIFRCPTVKILRVQCDRTGCRDLERGKG